MESTAHDLGVITNGEFAIFQNAGYMGLYRWLDVEDIHDKMGIEVTNMFSQINFWKYNVLLIYKNEKNSVILFWY